MNLRIRRSHLYQVGIGLLAMLMLLPSLAACRAPTELPADTEEPAAIQTSAPETEGDLILEQGTVTDEPDVQVPVLDMQDGVNYAAVLITSYYATGNVAGDAHVDASYVELYNNSDTAISLAGLSLYVSNKGGSFTEYRFHEEDTIPAEGYFLVRGRDANGSTPDVLSVERYDRLFKSLSPDPKNTRLALAPAGLNLPTDKPMAAVTNVFAYVTTHTLDAADEYHFIDSASVNKVVRKKACTDKVDYQSINLTKASWTVLSQIRPHTAEGDVNTEVHTQIDEVYFRLRTDCKRFIKSLK